MTPTRCFLCNKTQEKGRAFHRIPKNPKTRPSWIAFCKLNEDRDDVSKVCICSEHFSTDDYIEPRAYELGNRLLLKPGRVPSIRCSTSTVRSSYPSTSKTLIEAVSPKLTMGGGTYCIRRGCSSKTKENITLFGLPNEISRCKEWLIACNRLDLLNKPPESLKSYKICEKHFEEGYVIRGGTRKRLFGHAIPTLDLPEPYPEASIQNVDTHYNSNTDSEALTLQESEIKVEEISIEIEEDPLEFKTDDSEDTKVHSKSILQLAPQGSRGTSLVNAAQTQPSNYKTVLFLKGDVLKQIQQLATNQAQVIQHFKFPSNINMVQTALPSISNVESHGEVANDANNSIKIQPNIGGATENENSSRTVNISKTGMTRSNHNNCCAYKACTQVSNNASVQLIKFPKEYSRAVAWLILCNRSDVLLKSRAEILAFLVSSGVCFHHYKEIYSKLSGFGQNDDEYIEIRGATSEKPVDKVLAKKVIYEQGNYEVHEDNNENTYVPIRDYCAFINCSTHIKNLAVRKYRFPRDEYLLIKWLKAAGVPDFIARKDLDPLFICGKHFTAAHYLDRRTLKVASVPEEYGSYVDDKATDTNPHWLRKVRCTRKKYSIKSPSEDQPSQQSATSTKYMNMTGPEASSLAIGLHSEAPLEPIDYRDFSPSNSIHSLTHSDIEFVPEKCCVKHCQSDDESEILFTFPEHPNEYNLWVKAVENRAYITESVLAKYRMKRMCYKHFNPRFFMGNNSLSPNAVPTLNLVDDKEFLTEAEDNRDIEWKDCLNSVVDTDGSHVNGFVKRKIILRENSIEFPNLKKELRFGKGCTKKDVNKFPYKIYRLPYNHNPQEENIRVGQKLQIHTAIVVDDDDKSERSAIEMICDVIKRNEVPAKRIKKGSKSSD